MVLESFFDWLFQPFMKLGAAWAVILVSILLTVIINLFYKFFTDQHLMKALKKELKELQKEMKTLTDNPEKFMKIHENYIEKLFPRLGK